MYHDYNEKREKLNNDDDIKVKIPITQLNCEYRLCKEKDKTVNHIISGRSKLAQKEYKTRHEWVGKVIHR